MSVKLRPFSSHHRQPGGVCFANFWKSGLFLIDLAPFSCLQWIYDILLSEQIWHSKLWNQRFSFEIKSRSEAAFGFKPVCPFTFEFPSQKVLTHLQLIFSQLFTTKQSIVLLTQPKAPCFFQLDSYYKALYLIRKPILLKFDPVICIVKISGN